MPENRQEREKKAAYLIYLDCMMTFSQMKFTDIKKKGLIDIFFWVLQQTSIKSFMIKSSHWKSNIEKNDRKT